MLACHVAQIVASFYYVSKVTLNSEHNILNKKPFSDLFVLPFSDLFVSFFEAFFVCRS